MKKKKKIIYSKKKNKQTNKYLYMRKYTILDNRQPQQKKNIIKKTI